MTSFFEMRLSDRSEFQLLNLLLASLPAVFDWSCILWANVSYLVADPCGAGVSVLRGRT